MNLKEISTKDLVNEISSRYGVRAMRVESGEYHRTQVAGDRDSHLRYIRGQGKAVILEVKDI